MLKNILKVLFILLFICILTIMSSFVLVWRLFAYILAFIMSLYLYAFYDNKWTEEFWEACYFFDLDCFESWKK